MTPGRAGGIFLSAPQRGPDGAPSRASGFLLIPVHWLGLVIPGAEALAVIPAKAGIQALGSLLDPGFRRGDGAC
jgi:hypothetical protein